MSDPAAMEEEPKDIVDDDGEGDPDGDDGEDGDAKAEYVKKEYFARPYVSESGMLDEV